MQFYKILTSLSILFLSFSFLSAEDNNEVPSVQVSVEEGQELNLNEETGSSEKRVENKSYYKPLRQSIAKVGISSTEKHFSRESLFFQTNIGVGFLYFSGLRGNLMGRPVTNFAPGTNWRDVPMKGRLSYNRTPLYEYLLGYQVKPWLKMALSYQYQGGVIIESRTLPSFVTPTPTSFNQVQFASSFSLNAILFKLYFELPYSLNIKNAVTIPYLSVGVGPGWQSWTDTQVFYLLNVGGQLPLRQKISANAVWMIDLGFKLQKAALDPSFSFLFGCKYNQWGQARSMGKMSQQGNHKRALTHPIRVKTVYQFAPYLGFQWNFPNTNPCPTPYTLNGKVMNPWIPYFRESVGLQSSKVFWTQFNVGVGFLYFSGVRANLMGRPAVNFLPASNWRDIPHKGRLSYNRTPLFEYLLGYQVNPCLKVALSYQYQTGVTVQTKSLQAYLPTGASSTEVAKFTSLLSLNAILFKLYFNSPYAMIMRNLSFTPYLAVGVGPGWQSWVDTQITYMLSNTSYSGSTLPLVQKLSANAVWMLDVGVRVQNVFPNPAFSAFLGCKYNQWGQARNIGKMSQQGAHKIALSHPFIIKTVYQFAPYLGVQWNFPDTFMPSPYYVNGKKMNPCIPYFMKTNSFQCPTGFWSQFNVGVGFLYFSGLRANLMGRPGFNFTAVSTWRDVPLKGRLSYNPTPIFEYLVGYKFSNYLKLALSYQHQGGVSIQTRVLSTYPNTQPGSQFAQLASRLTLDALMCKLYFELPYALVIKKLSIAPYLAVGVGAGWQSWTLVQGVYMSENATYVGDPLPLRQKISANAVWMLDKGFRIQSAYPKSSFSVLIGAKYNQWGQARSIGKLSQQGPMKLGLVKPLRIKTVYQFAPYVGVQWLF